MLRWCPNGAGPYGNVEANAAWWTGQRSKCIIRIASSPTGLSAILRMCTSPSSTIVFSLQLRREHKGTAPSSKYFCAVLARSPFCPLTFVYSDLNTHLHTFIAMLQTFCNLHWSIGDTLTTQNANTHKDVPLAPVTCYFSNSQPQLHPVRVHHAS